MTYLRLGGRPRTASTDRNTEKNQRAVIEKNRVTVRKLATDMGTGQRIVQERQENWDIGKAMPAGLLVF